MAVPVELIDTPPTTFVTASSRYAFTQVMLWGDQRVTTFQTYKRTEIANADSDQFTVVSPGEEYRPDLTSFRAYGTVDFWWRIMEANNISDIFDYKAGVNIRVPSVLT